MRDGTQGKERNEDKDNNIGVSNGGRRDEKKRQWNGGKKTGTKQKRSQVGLGEDRNAEKSREKIKRKTMKWVGKRMKRACEQILGPRI